MIVVHKGLDNLDISFQAQISQEFAETLEAAKTAAQAARGEPQLVTVNGNRMHVEESGAKGGYAYRVDTGPFGATWMFKKPNPSDPWGIRVSMKSLPLAIYGLAIVREHIDMFLERLGIVVPPQGVSIGRVDFAVDILAPGFVLNPDCFVLPPRASQQIYLETTDVVIHGQGSRLTGIMVGKMPGREINFYCKRADVLKKRKVEWWEIWNHTLGDLDLPPLDPTDAEASNVWRVEFRAGKKELKDRWNIRTWDDLYCRLGDVMRELSTWARYTVPNPNDTNVSRWPEDPLWSLARETVADDLIDLASGVDPASIKRAIDAEYRRMLEGQIDGLAINWAVASDYDASEFAEAFKALQRSASQRVEEHPVSIEERFARVMARMA